MNNCTWGRRIYQIYHECWNVSLQKYWTWSEYWISCKKKWQPVPLIRRPYPVFGPYNHPTFFGFACNVSMAYTKHFRTHGFQVFCKYHKSNKFYILSQTQINNHLNYITLWTYCKNEISLKVLNMQYASA